jgi:endonuclease IV
VAGATFAAAPFIRTAPPGRKFRTALIGCGWWGKNILKEAMASGRCQTVALADVDATALEVAADQVNGLSGDTPKTYKDYRELLAREKPDIVIIATPDHWHALNTIAAHYNKPVEVASGHRPNGRRGSMHRHCMAADIRIEGVEPMGAMNRDEVLAAFKATGLQAASVCCHTHWVKPLSAPDEATRAFGLAGLVQSVQDAHAYGATSVLLVPGVARNGVSYEQCFERSVAEIKKVLPLAQELGVKIAIENVGNDFIRTPEQAVAYLAAFNSPAAFKSLHTPAGTVAAASATLATTSAGVTPPSTTDTTAGCAIENCNAAFRIVVPCAVQIASIFRTRSIISGDAGA